MLRTRRLSRGNQLFDQPNRPFKAFLKEKKTFQSEIFVSIKYNTTLIWWPKSRWNSEVAEFKGIQRFHTVHLRINHFYLKEQLRNEIPFCSLLFESIPPNLAFSIILVHDPAAKTASLTHEELGDLEEASAANASHLPARWLVTRRLTYVLAGVLRGKNLGCMCITDNCCAIYEPC